MGSKSGRKRRNREQQLKKRRETKASSASQPAPSSNKAPSSKTRDAAPASAPAEVPVPPPTPVEAQPRDEQGPSWSPPLDTAGHGLDLSPLPLTKADAATVPAKPDSDEPVTAPRAHEETPARVAFGTRETLAAVDRLETRVDRLTDWFGGFSAWYQFAVMSQADLEGQRARRHRLLVAAMGLIFLPVIVLAVVAIRSGWL